MDQGNGRRQARPPPPGPPLSFDSSSPSSSWRSSSASASSSSSGAISQAARPRPAPEPARPSRAGEFTDDRLAGEHQPARCHPRAAHVRAVVPRHAAHAGEAHHGLFGLLLRRPVSVDLIALETPRSTSGATRRGGGTWRRSPSWSPALRQEAGRRIGEQSRPKLPEVVIDPRDTSSCRTTAASAPRSSRSTCTAGPTRRRRASCGATTWKCRPREVRGAGGAGRRGRQVSFPSTTSMSGSARGRSNSRPTPAWRRSGAGSSTAPAGPAGLDLEEAKAANMAAKGVVTVSDQGGGVFALQPDGLLLTTPQKLLPEAKVALGLIAIDAKGVRRAALLAAAVGGQMRARRQLRRRHHHRSARRRMDRRGHGRGHAQRLAPGHASWRRSPTGRKVDVTLTTHGTTPDGPFDAKVVLGGSGRAAGAMWTGPCRRRTWNGGGTIRCRWTGWSSTSRPREAPRRTSVSCGLPGCAAPRTAWRARASST